MSNNKVTQRDLYQAIGDFRKEVNERFDTLEDNFVSQDEFRPIKACVYGGIGLILTAVVGALLKLVVFAANGK